MTAVRQAVFNCVTIALVGVNVFLLADNISLRQKIAKAPVYVTEVGYKFDPLILTDLEGRDVEFRFDNAPSNTLLLYFSPSCEYCVQQYPFWKELLQRINREKWRVVPVTREIDAGKIRSHLSLNKLQDFQAHMISGAVATKYRLGYTPMAVAIDNKGRVDRVWTGLWSADQMDSILPYFD